MARVRIPDEYKDGFRQFATLSNTQRQQLVDIVSENPAKTSNETIAKQVVEGLSIKDNEALSLVNSLASLAFGRENTKTTANDFAESIVEYLESTDFVLSEDVASSIKVTISSLLSTKSVYYATSKAQALTVQRERLFINGKVITDVRPIFSEEEDCNVEGVTIIHTLKMECQKGYDYEIIYIALDSNDLIELKVQIERAEKKESALRKGIASIPDKIY